MKLFIILVMSLLVFSCSGNNTDTTIYNGRLESDIVRISAEAAGKIDSLFTEEGSAVNKGQILALINSDKITTRLKQHEIQLQEIIISTSALAAQLKELEAQLKFSDKTLLKTESMLTAGAATNQTHDELETQVNVLKAKKEGLTAQKNLLDNKAQQIKVARELTLLALKDTRIFSPLNGQVLNRFVNQGELSAPGMALFEIADLSNMEANIYVPSEMLSKIKLGNTVEVSVDGQDKAFEGSVKWISSESEFTPKTILTEETRTTLVYRVKISVPNPDGILKIGMPVDVVF